MSNIHNHISAFKVENQLEKFEGLVQPYDCTVNSTSDYALWTLDRTYYKGISANIELQVHIVTCR
jgi:hypothetical protein